MTYFSKWESSLLTAILSAYQSADFNCGSTEEEMKFVSCPKAGNSDIHLDVPCDGCKYYKRFSKLMKKCGRHP